MLLVPAGVDALQLKVLPPQLWGDAGTQERFPTSGGCGFAACPALLPWGRALKLCAVTRELMKEFICSHMKFINGEEAQCVEISGGVTATLVLVPPEAI